LRDQFVTEVLAQHRKWLLGRCQHRFDEPQRIERQQGFTAEAVGARFANGLRKRIDDAKRNAARGEVIRQGQSGRPGTDDENVALFTNLHGRA
jgi:hypothetical protein